MRLSALRFPRFIAGKRFKESSWLRGGRQSSGADASRERFASPTPRPTLPRKGGGYRFALPTPLPTLPRTGGGNKRGDTPPEDGSEIRLKEINGATKSECSELAVSAPDDAHAVAAIAGAPPARVSRAGAMHVARLLEGLPYAPLPARAPLSFPASLLLGPQARHAAGGMGEGGSAVPTIARAFRHRLDDGIGGLMAVLTNAAGLARGPRRR